MIICRTLATYKGRPLLNAPRSDPYGRDSRIRLPPRVFDAEAVRRPRMEDLGRRQPFTRETFDPFPCRDVLLAAPPERAPPEVDNIEAERTEHANVGGRGVVVEPALDHLAKPLPLSRRRFMHALSQAFLESGGQAKGKYSAEGGLERASEFHRPRANSRSRRARDGHRFEVGANRPGFPAPTIRRQFSALARKLIVCGVYSAGTTGLGRRTRK